MVSTLECHPPTIGKVYPTKVINRVRSNADYYSLVKTNNSANYVKTMLCEIIPARHINTLQDYVAPRTTQSTISKMTLLFGRIVKFSSMWMDMMESLTCDSCSSACCLCSGSIEAPRISVSFRVSIFPILTLNL